MITIAEDHYHKIMELVRSLNRNMLLLHPSSEEIVALFTQWNHINQSLHILYKKLQTNLQDILRKNTEVVNENNQLNNKLQNQRSQNNALVQANTMQRAELAKNQAQLNKYKDGVKKLKESHKEKMMEKDQIIEELQKKVKKYKKITQEHDKKFEKLGKKMAQLQIAQRSQMKQKELDQELLQLENLCKDLNQGPEQFQAEQQEYDN